MASWVKSWGRAIPSDPGERWLLGLALGALLLGASMLLVAGGVGNLRHEPRIGSIVDGEGRRREANAFHWRLVGADTPVYLHDTIRAPKNAGIVVDLENGRRLSIPAGAVLRLDRMQDLRVEVTLLAGRMVGNEDVLVHDDVARRAGALLAVPRLPIPERGATVPR